MTRLLLRLFVRDYQNTADKKVREGYGVLSGALGIVCNLVLFAVKTVIGTLMSSIAITSDAFNNLTDMASSVVAVISAKMSNCRPDSEHPFGHGRFEYISSLVISFFIMLVGFELFKTSFSKIISPEPIVLKPTLLIILVLSLGVKLWMWAYNRKMGRMIDSKVLLATASDSLNDVFATSAVILSTLVSHYLALNIDGYISAAVSVMIMVVGIRLAVDTANVLLGSAPSPETVSQLEAFLSESPHVLGIHDLIVHDYGPGRKFASVHAEVSDREDITTIHEEIDAYEQRALKEFGMELVIHMDPISTDDTVLQGAHGQVVAAVRRFGDYPIHDFRMTDGENRINLIFDIVVPCSMTKEQRRTLVDGIKAALKAEDERYVTVIHVDDDYSMPRK